MGEPGFVTEIRGVPLAEIDVAAFRRAMDRYAVCVIRNALPRMLGTSSAGRSRSIRATCGTTVIEEQPAP